MHFLHAGEQIRHLRSGPAGPRFSVAAAPLGAPREKGLSPKE